MHVNARPIEAAALKPWGFLEEVYPLLRLRGLQLGALVLLLTGMGTLALKHKFFLIDFDIWWHLKVGDWIVQHGAVPHTGILSRTAANRPWVAYSWGYEVLLSRAYAWFGLIGIGVFGTLLTLMVVYSIYWMLRRLSGRFWISAVLTLVVCAAFLFDGAPRPFFFSMALFAVTLTILLEASRSGSVRLLYWLPPIFLIWANLHIQFIYGLFLVGLLMGVTFAQQPANKLGIIPHFVLPSTLPFRTLALTFVLCVLATLIGPNFYHPYVAVWEYSKAKFTYSIIVELQAPSFRDYSQYVELLLAAAAFYAVGSQKKLDLFKLSLLTIASVVAFRTMRDAWFICLPAGACIADFPMPETERERPESWLELSGVMVAVLALLALFSRGTDFNQRSFDRAISADYPVDAVNFLRRNPVPGPLYNNLNWGGFLMWYMPDYPVAIDGRNDLYGDKLDEIFFNSQNAAASYTADPYLDEAGVVLLDSKLPLAKILTIDKRFQLVYRDAIATVYARRPDATPRPAIVDLN